jgi:poly-gamma-glutamate synthesis protein (capsule biosynthesis protein)
MLDRAMPPPAPRAAPSDGPSRVTLCLCGDVMTGRGLDQVLPDPCDPRLHEEYARSAVAYVELAERASGRIPRPVALSYPWGDALDEIAQLRPAAWIVNLETAVTRREDAWPEKGIHYRTSPENARLLATAGIDCCVLANNHVLDWGEAGLLETLQSLDALGLRHAGAGRNLAEAEAPALLDLDAGGRLLVYAFAAASSGVPPEWAASEKSPGVALLRDLSRSTVERIAERTRKDRREGDLAIASLHWGGNWGFGVSPEQEAFAHALIENAGFDLVHGHSSHHVKGIAVHRGHLILWGCGDFLDDYEGISGYEEFRDELGLMYFATLERATGRLERLRMTPTRLSRFRVGRAPAEDAAWLAETLNREGRRFGTSVERARDGRLELRWSGTPHALGPGMATRARRRSESPSEVRIPPLGLEGILALPPDPPALVAFAHGSGSSRSSPRNMRVAEALRERGLGTLLFDLLTEEEASDRRHVFDIPLLAERLLEARRWLAGDERTRRLRVGYFGASTGAAAALVAAAAPGEPEVGAIVSRGGRPDLAAPVLAEVRAPTLLIVGGRDPAVLDLNRAALAELRCEKELAVVPGATHLFEEAGALEEVMELAGAWFARHLGAARRRGEA